MLDVLDGVSTSKTLNLHFLPGKSTLSQLCLSDLPFCYLMCTVQFVVKDWFAKPEADWPALHRHRHRGIWHLASSFDVAGNFKSLSNDLAKKIGLIQTHHISIPFL